MITSDGTHVPAAGKVRPKTSDVLIRSWLQLPCDFVRLFKFIFLSLGNITAEQLWQEAKLIFSDKSIETHWRGYHWLRPLSCPLIETVLAYFPPGTETGIHDHDSFNINLVIWGEVLEGQYKIRGGKPKPIREEKLTSGKFSRLMPFRSHNLRCPEDTVSPGITLNLHFPRRSE